MRALILLASILTLAPMCHSNPPGTLTSPVTGEALCMHLAAIQCPQPVGCAEAYDAVGSLTTINPTCLLNAGNKTEASRCGVTCQ